jgi:hypothetical protein
VRSAASWLKSDAELRGQHDASLQTEIADDGAEFKTALHEAGFGIDHGRIAGVSGKCPGFAVIPVFRNGVVNRNGTLSKANWEREAEIKRRPAAARR